MQGATSKNFVGLVSCLTVQPSLLAQEAHLMVRIAANQADHHGFLLAALEAVYGAQFNAWICLLEGLRQEGKLLYDMSVSLAYIDGRCGVF